MTTHNQRLGVLGEQIAARWLTRKGWRIVYRRFRNGRRDIDIVVQLDDWDEGREYETLERFEGEAVSIGFTVDYVIDFLSVTNREWVTIKMSDSEHQTLLEPQREEGTGTHKYVVMPLRID